jgi:hypothetical protein
LTAEAAEWLAGESTFGIFMNWVTFAIIFCIFVWVFGREKKPKAARVRKTANKPWLDDAPAVPRMDDGMPWPGEAVRMATELFDKGEDLVAIDLLSRCRNECGARDMISSVQYLSKEITGLRHRRAADAIGPSILSLLATKPEGIVQTDLYKMMPDDEQEIVRYGCYRLEEAQKITREKKGRSYLLRLAEQNKLE